MQRRIERPRRGKATCILAAAGALVVMLAGGAGADWPTSRGNANHTGNLDGQPGPRSPKVRWVFKAHENFLASPIPDGKLLFLPGLGGMNAAKFHALSLDPKSLGREVWTKEGRSIRLPAVASPAVVDGMLVFGDGMHQTDGGTLYCVRAATGRPLWRYEAPGKLVHMEGAPTISNGRVFLGGGDAGVLCIDPRQLTLEGKPIELPAAIDLLEKKWAELQTKYEKEKAVDGDLAIPPTEDELPKLTPALGWQKGKGQWHVDAPVDVADGRVLVASAYVEADKAGKRALLCLKEEDGSTLWETPLKLNPWGGATTAGDLAIVACGSIRFDKKLIPDAKGEVVAVNLADGQVKWRRDVPGGVLSPVAAMDGVAVFTATDGKVRAWDAVTGAERWVYDAGAPFFAGPAVAGGIVYAADLKGSVHAIRLADGTREWKFDLSSDPLTAEAGSVYGSPVVQGGEVFFATNHLEDGGGQQPSAVICLSDTPGGADEASAIAVDSAKRTVTVPCRIAPRKLPTLKEIYPLEVVATYPAPLGQKAHETVVVFDARPSDIHKALESLGLKPGAPARGEGAVASGPAVELSLIVPGLTGKPRRIPLERAMVDKRTGKPLPPLTWHFTGSILRQVDPDKPEKTYAADLTGTLISIFPVTDETVFQTSLTMKEEPLLKLETNKNALPEEGTPVDLEIRVK